jgi:ABC-type proline/glycine betaine transport system permease subunit
MRMDKDAIAAVANKVTYSGAGGAVFFGMTANEFAAIGGLCLAFIGLIVQIAFKIMGHVEMKKHHDRMEKRMGVKKDE